MSVAKEGNRITGGGSYAGAYTRPRTIRGFAGPKQRAGFSSRALPQALQNLQGQPYEPKGTLMQAGTWYRPERHLLRDDFFSQQMVATGKGPNWAGVWCQARNKNAVNRAIRQHLNSTVQQGIGTGEQFTRWISLAGFGFYVRLGGKVVGRRICFAGQKS